MIVKTYHYYMIGALCFVAWVLLIVAALQAAMRLTA